LLEGLKLTKKAAKVGFDWRDANEVFEKLDEEVAELKEAIDGRDAGGVAEEIGDLLFVIVNLARQLDVEPETALKKTNIKFRRRFKYIERELNKRGAELHQSSLEEMDKLWNQAKSEDMKSPE